MKKNLPALNFSRLLAPLCALGLTALLAAPAMSQTAPAAQTLPYTQNFGTATFTTLPLGVAAWNGVSGATVNSQALAEASAPTGNATLTAATAAQSSGGAYGYAVDGNAQLYIQTSSNATNGANQPVVAVNTTGQQNVVLSYDISVISAQPRTIGIVAQYRAGISGAWTTLTASSGLNPFSQAGGTTGLKTAVSVTLPPAANNQPVVQIRWAIWRGTESGSSSGVGLDNISVSVSGAAAISPGGSFAPFNTFAGTASASQSIGVIGSNLTSSITATGPSGFQVSSDGVSFGPTATLPSDGGTLYARVAASAPAGEISSSITLTSTGAADVAVPVNGAVRPTSIALPYGPDTFESTAFPWYTYTVAGTRSWVRASAGGNSFMEINGYDAAPGAVPANAWLVLGPFDFPAQASNIVASFNLQRAFNDAGDDSEFTFKYSSDYAGEGDPSSATWTGIPFTKPAAVPSSSTVFTPSGAVSLPPTLSGQTGVYVAFQLAATSATATSRWRMDDFELFTSSLPVVSVLVNPSTIDEGSTATGTVSIPEAVGSEVIVTVTSADPTLVLVDNGYGDAPAGSCEVPIFAGETSALFTVTTTRDFTPGTDVPVQITADGGAAYTFGQTIVTVRNIDLPAASLTSGGYTQDFAGFTSATLPAGWSLTPSDQTYSEWSTTTTGAKYSSASVDVFGYQHTGSTGVVRQILTLRNDTGETITDFVVSYLGRVARAAEGRNPSYAVTVNGTTVPALAYSTASGTDATVTAAVSGLSVAPNQTITIAWTSDGSDTPTGSPGSGSRRQIGIGEMSVTVGSAVLAPSVANLTIPLATIGQASAEVSADVTADGGSIITARGFVYSETSVNPSPEIGGTGVTDVLDASADVGVYSAALSGLATGTQYSLRAYAINAVGTSYTSARTFTTLGAPIEFTGNYAESFASYTGTLPAGWMALSSLEIQSYGGAWGTGSAGGFRGVSTNTGAVLGYQPTTTTGTLTVTARFVNKTGAPIENLNVAYLGRVARADQPRTPAWVVSVAGQEVPTLAYTTGNTSGTEGAPADILLNSAAPGLSIAPDAEFTVTWVAAQAGGSGTSRQIGLANFQVSTSEIGDPSINLGGSLTPFSATEGTASAAQSVSAAGTNLLGNITVTAPASYEVSLDNTTFAASVSLAPVNGTVASTLVYVRIAASAPVGNPAGQVSLASFGATTKNIAVTGTVSGGGSAYETWASGFGLDPATTGAPTADPDGDSFSNAQEYAFGTNPTQGNDSLLTSTASGGNLVVTWLQRSDVTYFVQSTGNLATTAFANDGTVSVVDGPILPTPPSGYARKQITVPASGQRFYRVTGTTP